MTTLRSGTELNNLSQTVDNSVNKRSRINNSNRSRQKDPRVAAAEINKNVLPRNEVNSGSEDFVLPQNVINSGSEDYEDLSNEGSARSGWSVIQKKSKAKKAKKMTSVVPKLRKKINKESLIEMVDGFVEILKTEHEVM